MGKAQGKKAAPAGRKSAVKQVVSRAKKAAGAAKKKVAAKKPARTSVSARVQKKKAVAPKPKPAKSKPAAKKTPQPSSKVKAKKSAAKKTNTIAKAKKVLVKAKATAKKAVSKAVRVVKAAAKPAKPQKPAKQVRPAAARPKAAPPVKANRPERATAKAKAPAVQPARSPEPAAVAQVAEPEKKRGRRSRTRIVSDGAPAAAWLTSEKPRPASFIPAPPRAEAPAAIAAPPASSDRLIRPEDVEQSDVRTVPVRVDIEQGAGRFYVIPNPNDVTVRTGEGVEWDFRYFGGADVTVEEIVVEFEKPSPFQHAVFRTRKPGGARPHRQLSDRVVSTAAGAHVEYTLRALNAFKTEVAKAKAWLTVIP
ncbi:MAG TPA: hypothetical protein VF701_16090 [Thermoanaerobaculia bacterium]